ncbi:hypothetical protein, partial [Microbulbifer sp. TYP-18]|uniref:hypothetical protein n=1 Tax=Microbulbifer sp. TYP-18 TaxID=3230024 RepID=UPI0034C5DAEB
GGTTSELSGGKFANGAITAAMQYVMNWQGGGESAQKGVTREWAEKELALMDAWLKENYEGFPDTNNFLIRINSPVDMALPPNINILEMNVNERIFQDQAFHEKLHVYIFNEIGSGTYFFSSNIGQIHAWINDTAPDLGRFYRGVTVRGEVMPDLKSYPRPQFNYFPED